ncbi:putative methyltransferase-domain-containing protein [Abortiporus biennis]|nr:putative methyltransferase-domain-containing protein [Abortiporus biennis]
MFLYITFLRPPPRSSPPGIPIVITPQIANDLRTELFQGSQDIYFSWELEKTQFNPNPSVPLAITKSQKLTTWREGTAYREINVPLPAGLRNGSSYRLVLTTHDQGHPHIINLGGPSIGSRPFPVISMPIRFSSQANISQNSSKQEQVERIYRIPLPHDERKQVFMKVKEQTSFDLDKKVWDSGVGLSSWVSSLISDDPSSSSSSGLVQTMMGLLFSKTPCDIIELGAGTGILSMTIGAIRSSICSRSEGGSIIITDLASAMPLLKENIELNSGLFSSGTTCPHGVVLDWETENLPIEVSNTPGGFHLIVMADVTYNTASFSALVRTWKKLFALHDPQQRSQKPLILLGYKERHPSERGLWDMALNEGIVFEKVGERSGAGDAPVEVWIGSPNGNMNGVPRST